MRIKQSHKLTLSKAQVSLKSNKLTKKLKQTDFLPLPDEIMDTVSNG